MTNLELNPIIPIIITAMKKVILLFPLNLYFHSKIFMQLLFFLNCSFTEKKRPISVI